jgi:hypothetical protein
MDSSGSLAIRELGPKGSAVAAFKLSPTQEQACRRVQSRQAALAIWLIAKRGKSWATGRLRLAVRG